MSVDYNDALGKDVIAGTHVESGMQKIVMIVESDFTQRNYKLEVLLNNIEAKTAMLYQPIDTGELLKIIGHQSRHSTIKESVSPLRKKLDKGMKYLIDTRVIILSPKKLNVILDCGSISPIEKLKSYSK